MNNTIELLKKLICIPSYVGNGVDETQVAECIRAHLSSLPLPWNVEVLPVEGTRVNIYVSNSERPETLFTAHIDTVPPSDAWKRDPFVPVVEDGKLYGLGAVDMKAGAASVMSFLLGPARETAKPMAALFYVGEEYDFCGMKAFAAQTQIRPAVVVTPEPTDLKVMRACRGVLECRFTVQGRAAHAAMGRDGVNAIVVATRAVESLTSTLASLPDVGLGVSTLNLAWIRGGLPVDGEIIVCGNVVPPFAEAVFEIRVARPEIDESYVRKLLTESVVALEGSLTSFTTSFSVKAMTPVPQQPTSFDVFPDGDTKTTGYFDTQLFVEACGSAPIVCGPGPSTVAHQPDEYVRLEDVEALDRTLLGFL